MRPFSIPPKSGSESLSPGIFFLSSDHDNCIIVINFRTTSRAASIFGTIWQLAPALALRAKISVAPLAMQYLTKISSAAPGTAIVVFSHFYSSSRLH